MDLKSLSKDQLRQTITYYLGFIGLGMVMVSSGPHLQNLLEHTNSTMDEFGVVFVILSIGGLIGSFLGGRLYDHLKGHRLIAACLSLLGITMAIMPYISSLWLMGAVMLLTGLALSLVDMGTNTLLTWVHGEKSAPYMNALHLAFGIGAAISPFMIGKFILATGDIYWSYWTLAILMVPLVVLFLSVKSPEIRRAEHASDSEIASQVNGKKARSTLVLLLIAFFFFYVGAEANFGNYITSYVQRSGFAVGDETAYQINSLFFGVFTIGRLIAIPLTAKVKVRQIITIDLLVSIAAFIVIVSNPQSIIALAIGSALAGLGMASVFPTMLTYAEQHLRLTARITSNFYLGISISKMFISWLIAQRFENRGPFSFMIILTILVILQIIVWGFIHRVSVSKKEIRPVENHVQ